jgi:hypothetical protein
MKETKPSPAADLPEDAEHLEDIIVRRPYRRPITGFAFTMQKCRLVLDMPDATGNRSYPCQIADLSDRGFGVVCPAAEKMLEVFHTGAKLTLEAWDGKKLRVEVRWVEKERMGLRRIAPKPR